MKVLKKIKLLYSPKPVSRVSSSVTSSNFFPREREPPKLKWLRKFPVRSNNRFTFLCSRKKWLLWDIGWKKNICRGASRIQVLIDLSGTFIWLWAMEQMVLCFHAVSSPLWLWLLDSTWQQRKSLSPPPPSSLCETQKSYQDFRCLLLPCYAPAPLSELWNEVTSEYRVTKRFCEPPFERKYPRSRDVTNRQIWMGASFSPKRSFLDQRVTVIYSWRDELY